MSDYIDSRLYSWAKWALSGRPNLGHKDRSNLYGMIKSGVIASGYGLIPEADAGDEEQTEKALQWLRNREQILYVVIATQYLGRGTADQKARDCGLRRRAYFTRLEEAKKALEIRLETMDEIREAMLATR